MKKFINNNRINPRQSSAIKKQKRIRLWPIIIILFLILLGIAGTLWGRVLFSKVASLSIFQFKKVSVRATEHIREAELRELIGEPTGENLSHLNLEQIKERVKKHPWVMEVKISRFYPDSIRADVIEKKAIALVAAKDLYFVDGVGKIIAPLRPEDSPDFPILSGIELKVGGSEKTILNSYEVIKLYEENDFLKEWPVSEIYWKPQSGFILFTKSPALEIRLGKGEFPVKFSRLEKVLKDLAQKNLVPQLIDLNFSKKVVVKVSK